MRRKNKGKKKNIKRRQSKIVNKRERERKTKVDEKWMKKISMKDGEERKTIKNEKNEKMNTKEMGGGTNEVKERNWTEKKMSRNIDVQPGWLFDTTL